MKKSLIAAALVAAPLTYAPAMAQDAAADTATAAVVDGLAVGATVFGPDGAQVGTIESMPAGNVVVDTGTHKATLPASAFGKNEKGLLISMTKTQLDSAVAAAEAKAGNAMAAALVADAEVRSKDGVVVGSVQKVEGESVIVDLPAGQAITLQKQHLMADASGLKLFMSAAEFQSAVAAAAGGSATTATQAAGAEDADAAATAGTDEAAAE